MYKRIMFVLITVSILAALFGVAAISTVSEKKERSPRQRRLLP